MKKIKFKSKKKIYINMRDKIVLIVLLILLCTFYFSFLFNKRSVKVAHAYAKNETTILSSMIITNAIKKNSELFDNMNEYIAESKNSDGYIVSVDFNTLNVNKSLTQINEEILEGLKKMKIETLEFEHETNLKRIESDKNMIYFIPFGIISNNIFLTSLGPKIPIKLNPIGRVISNINVAIEHYGINNVLFKMSIDVEVSQLILLPFISETVDIKVNIPLIIKIIEGEIPNAYGNLITSSSPISSLKVK